MFLLTVPTTFTTTKYYSCENVSSTWHGPNVKLIARLNRADGTTKIDDQIVIKSVSIDRQEIVVGFDSREADFQCCDLLGLLKPVNHTVSVFNC